MASHKLFHHLDVNLAKYTYPVIISAGGLKNQELLNRYLSGPQALIVTNKKVAPLYLSYLQKAYLHLQCDVLVLPDGENYKNQESLFKIYDTLIKHNHHRDTTIIALGGGVIGDLAGFAASTWQRGVNLLQVPTTLLAQVDAAIGGKTAINHPAGKNLIGSFYQPVAVLVDPAVLSTLPERELRAGFAEIIKYGLLTGGAFYSQLIQQTEQNLLKVNSVFLADCIAQCCRIKASSVEQDEKETGSRALLNLGHTFAHALETMTDYTRWLHGEAVAIGLYCAALLSCQLGDFPVTSLKILEKLLKNTGLPHKIPGDIDLTKMLDYMHRDKKVKNNHITLVLMKEEGHCYLHHQITDAFLLKILELCQDPQETNNA